MSFYTYIITNTSKTTFYTGQTNNLQRRIKEHRSNRGIRKPFAGRYYCHKLVYFEEYKTRSEAINREKEIKLMDRKTKIELIKTKNPAMAFYNIWKLAEANSGRIR